VTLIGAYHEFKATLLAVWDTLGSGAVMSMGSGEVTAPSRKQGMNTRSSKEAELVAAGDVVGPKLWTRRFLHAPGYPVNGNILIRTTGVSFRSKTMDDKVPENVGCSL
jgi:hypothetical protein